MASDKGSRAYFERELIKARAILAEERAAFEKERQRTEAAIDESRDIVKNRLIELGFKEGLSSFIGVSVKKALNEAMRR